LKNRIISILLLFTIAAPLVATYSVINLKKFHHQQQIIKYIVPNLQPKHLIVIKISKADSHQQLRWKHDKEFEYNRQMFDIVNIETKGDTLVFTCFADNAETQLNKTIIEFVDLALGNDSRNQNENTIRLFNFLKSLYFSDLFFWKPIVCNSNTNIFFYNDICKTHTQNPPIPPPEFY